MIIQSKFDRRTRMRRAVLKWPVMVVYLDKRIKAVLLRQDVVARWPGQHLIERQMHSLVAPVLLSVTRLDALHGDPEPQPPDGKPTHTEQGMR